VVLHKTQLYPLARRRELSAVVNNWLLHGVTEYSDENIDSNFQVLKRFLYSRGNYTTGVQGGWMHIKVEDNESNYEKYMSVDWAL